MNKVLTNLFIFLAGAVVGSGITYYLLNREDQYEIISGEETDESESDDEDSSNEEYSDIIIDNGYATDTKKEVDDKMENRPYVIPPDEFDMMDYDTSSLTYYADGVLADECNNKIDDIDEIVGLESLEHFGEYEDDSVFVRNDKLKIDYEILLDVRRYEDAL